LTKDEKQHYSAIAGLGCSLCRHLGYGETPCEIHHIRRAGKRDNAPVIGLCPEHHRGNNGVHGLGRKAFERKYKTSEEELLVKSLEILIAAGVGGPLVQAGLEARLHALTAHLAEYSGYSVST
jgi:hypothetical protein